MNTFKANGYLLGGVVVIHGVLSVINVYVKNDSKKIRYKKLNMKTYLQRISAFCLVVLLPLHIMAFGILKSTAFSKCLIPVGVLEDERKMIVNIRKKLLLCYNDKMTI